MSPVIRRRRPLMRAAVVGGVGAAAYHSGKRSGADQQRAAQESAPEPTQEPAQPAPAQSAPTPPSTSTSDRIAALERLSALRDQGVLSAEEFETEKRKVLESG